MRRLLVALVSLDDAPARDQRKAMSGSPRGLSDPVVAAVAWARFRRVMRWMVVFAVAAVIAAILYLRRGGSPLPVHMLIATIAGVFLTVLLGTGLMMLAFLSAGTGHDDAAAAGPDPRV
jgi:hypothetical protein